MRISRVDIKNFRQYSEASFVFDEAEPDVSVVVGRIGSGKTNFLNAVTWCLYDVEHFAGGDREVAPRRRSGSVDSTGRAMPTVNVGPIDQDMAPGRRDVSVEIAVELDDGSRALISRKQSFVVSEGNRVQSDGESVPSVMLRRGGAGYDPVPEPKLWINRHLPERIRPYFILNTERLQQFLHQSAEASRVKDAILEIAQIDVLKTMLARLANVREDYYATADKGDPDSLLHKLEAERVQLDHAIAGLRQDETGFEADLAAHDHTIAEILDQVGDVEAATALIKEHELKSADLVSLQARLDSLETSLVKQCALDAPAVFGLPDVELLLKHINQAISAGRWPAPVAPGYVQQMLDEHFCICGTEPFTDGMKEHLEEELRRHDTASNKTLMDLLGPASVLRDRAEAFRSRLRPIQEQIAAEHRDGQALQLHIDALTNDIEKMGLQDKDFEITRERWSVASKGRDLAIDGLARVRQEIERKEASLAETTKKLKFELKKSETQQEIGQLVQFSEQCIAAVNRAYDELIRETREEVSAALDESFLGMISETKGDTFKGAGVDENYCITVEHQLGFNAAENLGGGEDVCLALSFSQALGRVSGFSLPLILDSPFVKLDPDAMSLVMQTMLDKLGTRQLIVLLKTQEYNPGVQAVLGKAGVMGTYTLEFSEEYQSTAVGGV